VPWRQGRLLLSDAVGHGRVETVPLLPHGPGSFGSPGPPLRRERETCGGICGEPAVLRDAHCVICHHAPVLRRRRCQDLLGPPGRRAGVNICRQAARACGGSYGGSTARSYGKRGVAGAATKKACETGCTKVPQKWDGRPALPGRGNRPTARGMFSPMVFSRSPCCTPMVLHPPTPLLQRGFPPLLLPAFF
jgi:hypothetical protein